uniref:Uncharacterized protein n=1 Tax=Bursaphelenchus xylophilus TaxID=6326 RepID=A0A1I7SG35_BURXY
MDLGKVATILQALQACKVLFGDVKPNRFEVTSFKMTEGKIEMFIAKENATTFETTPINYTGPAIKEIRLQMSVQGNKTFVGGEVTESRKSYQCPVLGNDTELELAAKCTGETCPYLFGDAVYFIFDDHDVASRVYKTPGVIDAEKKQPNINCAQRFGVDYVKGAFYFKQNGTCMHEAMDLGKVATILQALQACKVLFGDVKPNRFEVTSFKMTEGKIEMFIAKENATTFETAMDLGKVATILQALQACKVLFGDVKPNRFEVTSFKMTEGKIEMFIAKENATTFETTPINYTGPPFKEIRLQMSIQGNKTIVGGQVTEAGNDNKPYQCPVLGDDKQLELVEPCTAETCPYLFGDAVYFIFNNHRTASRIYKTRDVIDFKLEQPNITCAQPFGVDDVKGAFYFKKNGTCMHEFFDGFKNPWSPVECDRFESIILEPGTPTQYYHLKCRERCICCCKKKVAQKKAPSATVPRPLQPYDLYPEYSMDEKTKSIKVEKKEEKKARKKKAKKQEGRKVVEGIDIKQVDCAEDSL